MQSNPGDTVVGLGPADVGLKAIMKHRHEFQSCFAGNGADVPIYCNETSEVNKLNHCLLTSGAQYGLLE